ncbi:MAG TPA: T9SS type A sorting domain-containing protein [Bacteroidia bacterium]|nr:T9SS type A sorting domain-containing protein [Bacteroidota bacterium]HQW22263.1 T9SS type A sorting domain-containing protein [Bacteroidia bacterium]
MKAWSIILCFFILVIEGHSQGNDNLWMLGYQCCQQNFGGTDINFITGSPLISTSSRQMSFNITNASITDLSDNLLFYTNGWYIANSENDTMVNGSGLSLDPANSSFRQLGLPIVQGALIVPFDETSKKYYLFHEELCAPIVKPNKLFYTVIDMALDSGRGAVILKRQPLFYDTLDYGQITACRHANGRDWWITVPKANSDLYYIILSTPFGLSYTVQHLGFTILNTDGAGQSTFSPDGSKFARFAVDEGLNCFDFDRCTGTFSNIRNIPQSAFPAWQGCEGVSFSPNSRFLYLSYCTYLYQVDTWDTSLVNSRILIDIYDGFTSPAATTFFSSKLARDGKIYMNSAGSVNTMHVINSPDSSGIACDFMQHSVSLPTYNASTISTQPFFLLGAAAGSQCDSLLNEISNAEEKQFVLYPNPALEFIKIHFNHFESYQATIFDLNGKILKKENLSGNEEQILNLNEFASGIYFLKIETEKNHFYKRFIKE